MIQRDDQPAWLEAIEVGRQALDGVQVTFGQRMESRRRRGEPVKKSNLDEIEARVMPRDECTRLADVRAHGGQAVRLSRVVAEPALDEIDHVRIHFDRVDGTRTEGNRLQHVGAGSGAEDQHAWSRQQVIGQRRRQVVEVCQGFRSSVVADERARPVAVDKDAELTAAPRAH